MISLSPHNSCKNKYQTPFWQPHPILLAPTNHIHPQGLSVDLLPSLSLSPVSPTPLRSALTVPAHLMGPPVTRATKKEPPSKETTRNAAMVRSFCPSGYPWGPVGYRKPFTILWSQRQCRKKKQMYWYQCQKKEKVVSTHASTMGANRQELEGAGEKRKIAVWRDGVVELYYE